GSGRSGGGRAAVVLNKASWALRRAPLGRGEASGEGSFRAAGNPKVRRRRADSAGWHVSDLSPPASPMRSRPARRSAIIANTERHHSDVGIAALLDEFGARPLARLLAYEPD